MNEIKKCSIGGISFTLEQNAYDALNKYIDTLKAAYKEDPDGEEIMADIEARIAELILSTQSAEGVVALPLIENIIKQLGTPHEIDEEKADNAPRSTEHTDINGNPRIPRRMYRDLENSKLGGVCAGLAKYFNIDPTWIRLAMFVPLLLSSIGTIPIYDGPNFHLSIFMGNLFSLLVVAYIIMWFVVPAASSARQKLEQQGERITAQGIKNNTPTAPDERERTLVAKIVMLLGNIMLITLKVIVALMLIGLVVGGSVLCIVALSVIPVIAFNFATGLALLAFFLVALIPIFAVIYLAISFIGSHKPSGKSLLIMLIIWTIMLSIMTVSAIKSPTHFGNQIENAFESVFESDEDILFNEFSKEEVDAFRQQMGINKGDSSAEDGDVTRTHVLGQTTMTLAGQSDEVEALEANIKFSDDGIQISENGKSVLKISHDGITIDDKQIASIEEKKGRFEMNIGGVKISIEEGSLQDE